MHSTRGRKAEEEEESIYNLAGLDLADALGPPRVKTLKIAAPSGHPTVRMHQDSSQVRPRRSSARVECIATSACPRWTRCRACCEVTARWAPGAGIQHLQSRQGTARRHDPRRHQAARPRTEERQRGQGAEQAERAEEAAGEARRPALVAPGPLLLLAGSARLLPAAGRSSPSCPRPLLLLQEQEEITRSSSSSSSSSSRPPTSLTRAGSSGRFSAVDDADAGRPSTSQSSSSARNFVLENKIVAGSTRRWAARRGAPWRRRGAGRVRGARRG
jgi:hypothetical protein